MCQLGILVRPAMLTAADCVVLDLSQFVDSLDTSTLHSVRGTRQDWISLINSENVPFASFSICDPYQIGKKPSF